MQCSYVSTSEVVQKTVVEWDFYWYVFIKIYLGYIMIAEINILPTSFLYAFGKICLKILQKLN